MHASSFIKTTDSVPYCCVLKVATLIPLHETLHNRPLNNEIQQAESTKHHKVFCNLLMLFTGLYELIPVVKNRFAFCVI